MARITNKPLYSFALLCLLVAGCAQVGQGEVATRPYTLRLKDLAKDGTLNRFRTAAETPKSWCATVFEDEVAQASSTRCATHGEPVELRINTKTVCIAVHVDANADDIVDAALKDCSLEESGDDEVAVYEYNTDPGWMPPVLALDPKKALPGTTVTASFTGEFTRPTVVQLLLQLHRDNTNWPYWSSTTAVVEGAVEREFTFTVGEDWPATNTQAGSAYYLTMNAASHIVGGPTLVVLAPPEKEQAEPEPALGKASMVLNGGATTTTHPVVNIALAAEGAAYYRLGRQADLSAEAWIAMVPKTTVVLSVVGKHTLYAQFATERGAVSEVVSASINLLYIDVDADGLPDDWELSVGLPIGNNDGQADSDADGLTNLAEYLAGTDPQDADTDDDYYLDGDDADPLVADLSNPDTLLVLGPAAQTTATVVSISFTSDSATAAFECRPATGAWYACQSPLTVTVTAGNHSYEIRAHRPPIFYDETPLAIAWETVAPAPVTGVRWAAVELGQENACALDAADRSLWCWGNTGEREFPFLSDTFVGPITKPTTFGGSWQSITRIDWENSWCGATAPDGELRCWGANQQGSLFGGASGRVSAPTAVSVSLGWKSVRGGGAHACAIDGGDALWCWGGNGSGQLGDGTQTSVTSPQPVSTGTVWQSIALGSNHTCGIRSDTSLWCWGENWNGQLGQGDDVQRLSPVPIGSDGWQMISAGDSSTCGLTSNGSLWCWGAGALGSAQWEQSLVPKQLGIGQSFTSVSMAGGWGCAVETAGALWCWGRYIDGETARLFIDWGLHLVDATTAWAAVDLKGSGACAISNGGDLFCWGGNANAALGLGYERFVRTPAQVAPEIAWNDVFGFSTVTCARDTSQRIWCWGSNDRGEIGVWDLEKAQTPVLIEPTKQWSDVGIGGKDYFGTQSRSCAIDTAGALYCWGHWHTPTSVSELTAPTDIAPGQQWLEVEASTTSACAIHSDTTLWCWGSKSDGQLAGADGPYSNVTEPTLVPNHTGWSRINLGQSHGCGIKTDETLWCWGWGYYGQLGLGLDGGGGTYGNNKFEPVQVEVGTTWKDIAAGWIHTCGIQTAGSLWCWGGNFMGVLGDGIYSGGSTVGRAYPYALVTGSTWKSVAAGWDISCAIRSDDTLWCWGDAFRDSPNALTTPTQIGTAANWVKVAPGATHVCALNMANELWCWGENRWGEVGNGTAWREQPTMIDR